MIAAVVAVAAELWSLDQYSLARRHFYVELNSMHLHLNWPHAMDRHCRLGSELSSSRLSSPWVAMDCTMMYLHLGNRSRRDIRIAKNYVNSIERGPYKYIERLAADCPPMMDSQTHLSWARLDQCDIGLLGQLSIEMVNLENLLHSGGIKYIKNEWNSTAHTCIMLSG